MNLRPELVVVKGGARLAEAAKAVVDNSDMSVVLYSEDAEALKKAAAALAGKNPLIGPATMANCDAVAAVAKEAGVPGWLKAANLDYDSRLPYMLSAACPTDNDHNSASRAVQSPFILPTPTPPRRFGRNPHHG